MTTNASHRRRALVRVVEGNEEVLMKRKSRARGGNAFAAVLAVLVGLLWAGTIDAEMKWTATMFGLALAALLAANRD